jgi:repressor LexA
MQRETTETVYNFICAYVEQHSYPPTIRAIASGCYINVSTVLRHLDRLETWGWISREPGVARGIRVLPREKNLAP